MYRINYILFLLVFIIQQSLAGLLNDMEDINKSKLIPLNQEDVTQGMQNIPSTNMLKLQTFVKQSKTSLKLALPLLVAGIAELYLNKLYNNKTMNQLNNSNLDFMLGNYSKAENNFILSYFPLFILNDIILSSSFIVTNKTAYQHLINPFLIVSDLYYSGLAHLLLLLYSDSLSAYYPLTGFITIYALISGFFNIKHRLEERFNIFETIEEYENNINACMQLVPTDKYLEKTSNIFLYRNKNIKLADDSIEDFYKWITQHKNDICLHKLIDCSYTPRSITNYSTKKLANIASIYQPGDIDHQTVHCIDSKLTFKLIKQNKKLTQELLTSALLKPGIKLIEVDNTDTENKTTYKYVGFINDDKNYYLVLAIELNNEITKLPKTYREIIYNSIFNNNTDYPETSTLVIKYDSIDKIQSIMEYLFLYLSFNHHTCVYDVTLNNNMSDSID